MYIRTDYEISLCPAIRLGGGRSAENGPNLRQIQVATTSNRLYVIYYELITTLSRLLSETLVIEFIKSIVGHKKIWESVIVIVTDGHTHSITLSLNSGISRHIEEAAGLRAAEEAVPVLWSGLGKASLRGTDLCSINEVYV